MTIAPVSVWTSGARASTSPAQGDARPEARDRPPATTTLLYADVQRNHNPYPTFHTPSTPNSLLALPDLRARRALVKAPLDIRVGHSQKN
ncbi:uncharacterized protein BT62DRAFT_1079581 [Guyanagaster necrorhizus]|uniref:Uncharacterized protein n=1 Tax=Guyanagaster necrorhizus TaxID=856835 RepID=A0A9P7VLA0_9AGAR|nr:uncharacterized protein BT62DRAFT_1079581 [Guyanagaster necrorhizus MCA 3950]KAG7442046.1 hypothetical protein BT62DRAFT_1079581 [Guyanagaster necrorhizus MCA 3950]